jgi:hypothetical protein
MVLITIVNSIILTTIVAVTIFVITASNFIIVITVSSDIILVINDSNFDFILSAENLLELDSLQLKNHPLFFRSIKNGVVYPTFKFGNLFVSKI